PQLVFDARGAEVEGIAVQQHAEATQYMRAMSDGGRPAQHVAVDRALRMGDAVAAQVGQLRVQFVACGGEPGLAEFRSVLADNIPERVAAEVREDDGGRGAPV